MNGAGGVGTVAAVAVAVVVMLLAGLYRPWAFGARTRSGRAVPAATAAAALSGEYLSGAIFLGFTGLALSYGLSSLWFTLGALAGFVLLIALVVAPLRRSGAYTLSDFTEWRLQSRKVRRVASASVCFAAWIYLLPQFRGAGQTLGRAVGAPQWVGAALVVAVVGVIVMSGRMRNMTVGQALQYWLKLIALAIPLLALLIVWHGPAPTIGAEHTFTQRTQVKVLHRVRIDIAAPVTVRLDGRLDGHRSTGAVRLASGAHLLDSNTKLTFPAGARMPHAQRVPSPDPASEPGHSRWRSLYGTYSLLVALMLGTMGLPYLALRLHSVPSVGVARRTVLGAIGLLAVFFLLPPLYGLVVRHASSGLAVIGPADAAILSLPGRFLPGIAGQALNAVFVAGIFCAFLSATTAIVLAVGATISQCLLGGGVHSFRLGALIAIVVPAAVLAFTAPMSPGTVVAMAFAVAAATLCPLLILGIWWRGLTGVGAATGMIFGGGLTVACAVLYLTRQDGAGWTAALIAHPALVATPVGFGVMWAGSVLTRRRIPDGVTAATARMHLPEEIGTAPRDPR